MSWQVVTSAGRHTVWCVSGISVTDVMHLTCRFPSLREWRHVSDISFPVVSRMSPVWCVIHMSFSIDESGMSIQIVMSMMSCGVSRMFQSYHGCHASVALFLVSRAYPVVSGRRFWHINRVRRVTDDTRHSFHIRSSHHVCHASGV